MTVFVITDFICKPLFFNAQLIQSTIIHKLGGHANLQRPFLLKDLTFISTFSGHDRSLAVNFQLSLSHPVSNYSEASLQFPKQKQ